jgi:hypothetical protein
MLVGWNLLVIVLNFIKVGAHRLKQCQNQKLEKSHF